MQSTTGTKFSIIREGEFKEETWEWSDIETMSRAGRLSRNCLVYLPAEDAWKKLGDTELAGCFETAARPLGVTAGRPDTVDEEEDAEHEALLDEICANPNDVGLRLKAADVAVTAGRLDEARDHYQRALDASPYHPRVAQDAKRRLPASKWKTLRCLERPPQVWEDPLGIFEYALSRGPLYLLLPAAVLTGLFWTLWTTVPAALALALWTTEIVRSTSRGEKRVPLWNGLAADPLGRIVRPLVVTISVAVELSALFVAVAGFLIVTRLSDEANVMLVIAGSPVLTVLVCTLYLAYFPAVVMLTGASPRSLLGIVNPVGIVRAIRVMEGEYLLSVLIIGLLFCATWGVGTVVGGVPVVGRLFYAAATAFIVVFGGFVLGRLYARYREQLDSPPEGAGSDAE